MRYWPKFDRWPGASVLYPIKLRGRVGRIRFHLRSRLSARLDNQILRRHDRNNPKR